MKYELIPLDNRKSFYNKAYVERVGAVDTLYSYNTPVMRKNADGSYSRLWGGYSMTTMRHVNAFVGHPMGKKEWEAMEVER